MTQLVDFHTNIWGGFTEKSLSSERLIFQVFQVKLKCMYELQLKRYQYLQDLTVFARSLCHFVKHWWEYEYAYQYENMGKRGKNMRSREKYGLL